MVRDAGALPPGLRPLLWDALPPRRVRRTAVPRLRTGNRELRPETAKHRLGNRPAIARHAQAVSEGESEPSEGCGCGSRRVPRSLRGLAQLLHALHVRPEAELAGETRRPSLCADSAAPDSHRDSAAPPSRLLR